MKKLLFSFLLILSFVFLSPPTLHFHLSLAKAEATTVKGNEKTTENKKRGSKAENKKGTSSTSEKANAAKKTTTPAQAPERKAKNTKAAPAPKKETAIKSAQTPKKETATKAAQALKAQPAKKTSPAGKGNKNLRPSQKAAQKAKQRPELQVEQKAAQRKEQRAVQKTEQRPKAERKRESIGTLSATSAEQLGLTVKRIMIDPGHGGKDPGAQNKNFNESRFALNMAKSIGKLLSQRGFQVYYTRTGDEFIPLSERPQMANKQKVDLFISIHANSNTDTSIKGLETYYLDSANSKRANVVAARENGVPVEEISDLQFILAELVLPTKLAESRQLAKIVQESILAQIKNSKFSLDNNGIRSAPFYVLMGAKMPAILIECAYASNPEDLKKLQDDSFIQSQAQGVADAIVQYRNTLEKKRKNL